MFYNYVFFDESGSYFRIARSDLNDFPYCLIRESGFLPQANIFKQFLFKAHTSRHFSKNNRAVPLQNIWNKNYIGKLYFPENKPICFVFATALATYYDMKLFEYLRKNFPDCRLVLLLRDIVQVCLNRSGGRSINDLLSTFDQIYTINSNDEEKYGFKKINPMCSRYPVNVTSENVSDIVFIGRVKDRADTINQIYTRLTNAGVNCDFTLMVDKSEKNIADGIKVIFRPIKYEEMLEKTVQSKCVLEVTQKGISSVSARCMEALCYNKKLVTDIKSVKSMRYYNSKYMFVYDSPEEIDPDFIKENINVDYNYDDSFSPINLLKHIDDDLTAQ